MFELVVVEQTSVYVVHPPALVAQTFAFFIEQYVGVFRAHVTAARVVYVDIVRVVQRRAVRVVETVPPRIDRIFTVGYFILQKK